MPIFVKSDRKAQFIKEREEMMNYMEGPPEIVPVDLNGARTDYPKGAPTTNLLKAQGDIRRRFDLDLPVSRNDMKGGE